MDEMAAVEPVPLPISRMQSVAFAPQKSRIFITVTFVIAWQPPGILDLSMILAIVFQRGFKRFVFIASIFEITEGVIEFRGFPSELKSLFKNRKIEDLVILPPIYLRNLFLSLRILILVTSFWDNLPKLDFIEAFLIGGVSIQKSSVLIISSHHLTDYGRNYNENH